MSTHGLLLWIFSIVFGVICQPPIDIDMDLSGPLQELESSICGVQDQLGLSLEFIENSVAIAHHDELGMSLEMIRNDTRNEIVNQRDELGLSVEMFRNDTRNEIVDQRDELGLSLELIRHDTMNKIVGPCDELGQSLGLSDVSSDAWNVLNVSVNSESSDNQQKLVNSLESKALDNSVDELGTSMIDFSPDSEAYSQFLPIDSSTPSKSNYGMVSAKTPVRKAKDYMYADVSGGKQMKKRAMNLADLKKTLREQCNCGRECFSAMTVKSLSFQRYLFWSKPKYLRMYWLIHTIGDSKKHGRHRLIKLENNAVVCVKAFLKILRINKNTFTIAKKLSERNSLTTSGKKSRSESEATLLAISWLESFATSYGDRMPNSDDVLLPYRSEKQRVYRKYKSERSMTDAKTVSSSQFYKIWKTRFPHLKIRQTNPFSKCTTCFALERCEEKSLSPRSRSEIQTKLGEHHDRQMCERRYYYTKKEKSRTDPDNFMSIIIDGMDQSKTNLPHFAGRRAKNINPCALLKTHVTGVINHGHGGFHTYIDFNQYPHDPNLTMNIILKALKRAANRNGNQLPPTLFVQADNCWRENKNRFVFAFMQLLVEKHIFKEIHLSFLYVGHTHEDVDQAFSVYSKKLKVTDTETIPELLALFGDSVMLSDMFDIKGWLLPHLEELKHITKPLHFKFSKVSEQIKTHYKGQHNSEWILLETNFLKKVPVGQPITLKPDYSRVDNVLNLKQVLDIEPYFKNQRNVQIWKDFYSNIEKKIVLETNEPWILDSLPRQHQTMTQNDEIVSIPEHVHNLLNKETDIPKIITKKKQKEQPSKAKPKPKSRKGGRKQNEATEKNSKGQYDQTKDQKKRPKRQVVSKFVTIPLTDETKRHLWIMLFMNLLLPLIVLYMCILYSMCILWALRVTLESAWAHIIIEHCALMNALVHSLGTFGIELLVQKLYSNNNLIKI